VSFRESRRIPRGAPAAAAGLAIALIACGPPDRVAVGDGPRFDLHVHIRSPTAARLMREAGDIDSAGALTGADAVAAMDEAGVERALILSLAYRFGSPDLELADEAELVRAENDFVAEEVAAHPDRLVGACSVNPLAPYALEEIERCLDVLHLPVLKLHLTNSDVDLRSSDHLARLREVFRILERGGAAAFVHMRTGSEAYGAEDARRFIAEVLMAAPGVPVEIAHMSGWGGYDEATDDALGELARAMEDGRLERGRVWFGLGAVVFSPAAAGADTALARRVREANASLVGRIREIGTDRVTYGTDWPSWPPVADRRTGIARNADLIRSALGLTPEELAEVFANPGLLGAL